MIRIDDSPDAGFAGCWHDLLLADSHDSLMIRRCWICWCWHISCWCLIPGIHCWCYFPLVLAYFAGAAGAGLAGSRWCRMAACQLAGVDSLPLVLGVAAGGSSKQASAWLVPPVWVVLGSMGTRWCMPMAMAIHDYEFR
jgi:hypothetical protein